MKNRSAPFLSYKLDVLKSASIRAANVFYRERVDLSIRELRVLRLIHDSPGILTTDLRQRLFMDKTVLSKDISFLERRGLLLRSLCSRDSRQHCLALTPEGERVWKESEEIGRRLEDEMYAELGEEEWRQLHALLDKALLSFEHWNSVHEGRASEVPRS